VGYEKFHHHGGGSSVLDLSKNKLKGWRWGVKAGENITCACLFALHPLHIAHENDMKA
jgi:hypothetical protein